MALYSNFPGVEYVEKDFSGGARAITGIATDVAGMIIVAQKGPINKLTKVTSTQEAFEIFGSQINAAYGAYAIKGFFDNGGRELWIVRVAHYTDITDDTTLTAAKASTNGIVNHASTPSTSLSCDALWHGAEGNKIAVKIVDSPILTTESNLATTANATTVKLKSMRNVTVGMLLSITGGETPHTEYGTVVATNFTDKTVTLDTALTNVYPLNSVVRSHEFKLEVYYRTSTGLTLVESFDELTMEPTDKRYAVTIVNSESVGSKYVRITDMQSSVSVSERLPAVSASPIALTGGNDGTTSIADTDFIGSELSKTGLYAFDAYDGMISLCCVDCNTQAMIRAGYDYAKTKGNILFVGMIPNGLKPQSAADWRDEAGWNNDFGALYYNWGYVTDPIGIGEAPEKLIPLTGHILGAWARNDRNRGYGSTPAGESMTLIGVNRLEFIVDKTNGGALYGERNRNINPIVNLSGNGGIVIWGGRMQTTDSRWWNIISRRIFMYVEQSLIRGTRWAVFRNKNDTLYNDIKRVVTSFLSKVEGLSGNTNDERFAVVCDSTINDPNDPYVLCRIGLNIEGVGEFIFFEIGQTPEGVSLSEL